MNATDDEIIALYRELGTQQRVAEQLGVSQFTISVRMRKARARGVEVPDGRTKGRQKKRSEARGRRSEVGGQKKRTSNFQPPTSNSPGTWADYVRGGRSDQGLRNALVDRELPKLQSLAFRVAKRLPECVSTDDLVQVGAIALVDAARRYDPSRGFTFWTFSCQRAAGAMRDYLRDTDSLGRQARRLRTERARVAGELAHELGRQPTDEEIHERMGGSVAKWLSTCQPDDVSLATVVAQGEGRDMVVEGILADAKLPPELIDHDGLKHMVRGLSYQQQTIFYLYYVCKTTMKQIGQIMHVSESRISQLHSQGIDQLRRRAAYETSGGRSRGPASGAGAA